MIKGPILSLRLLVYLHVCWCNSSPVSFGSAPTKGHALDNIATLGICHGIVNSMVDTGKH